MAKLINGNGNEAIWAAQDADMIASICGNITSIAAVGSQFSYTQEDANTIGVSDGVIITKEGRRIQLDTGEIDLFTIPTGILGATSYYIIGYKLVQAANTVQTCETFVQKMDNSTDVIPEDTFKGGATEVYVSLYRVTQDGMNIDTVDLLLPKLSNVVQLISDLTANSNHFYFDYQNGKYGYNTDPNRGAGTFSPFSSVTQKQYVTIQGSQRNRTLTLNHDTSTIFFISSWVYNSYVMTIAVNGVQKTPTLILDSNPSTYGLHAYYISGSFKSGDVITLDSTQSDNNMATIAIA